jgi:hypothetical protein
VVGELTHRLMAAGDPQSRPRAAIRIGPLLGTGRLIGAQVRRDGQLLLIVVEEVLTGRGPVNTGVALEHAGRSDQLDGLGRDRRGAVWVRAIRDPATDSSDALGRLACSADRNSWPSIRSKVHSWLVRTVAVRGMPRRSPISPT